MLRIFVIAAIFGLISSCGSSLKTTASLSSSAEGRLGPATIVNIHPDFRGILVKMFDRMNVPVVKDGADCSSSQVTIQNSKKGSMRPNWIASSQSSGEYLSQEEIKYMTDMFERLNVKIENSGDLVVQRVNVKSVVCNQKPAVWTAEFRM